MQIPATVTGESSSLATTWSLVVARSLSCTLPQRAHATWTTLTATSNSFAYLSSSFSMAKNTHTLEHTSRASVQNRRILTCSKGGEEESENGLESDDGVLLCEGRQWHHFPKQKIKSESETWGGSFSEKKMKHDQSVVLCCGIWDLGSL